MGPKRFYRQNFSLFLVKFIKLGFSAPLIIDFNKFCIYMCSRLYVYQNVNSRTNLIFVSAFHPKYNVHCRMNLRCLSTTYLQLQK